MITGRVAGSSYSALKSSILMRGTSCSVEPEGTVGCTVWMGGAPEGTVGLPAPVVVPVPFVTWGFGITPDWTVGTSAGRLVIGVGTGAIGPLPGLPNSSMITPMPTTTAARSAPITYGKTSRFGVTVVTYGWGGSAGTRRTGSRSLGVSFINLTVSIPEDVAGASNCTRHIIH